MNRIEFVKSIESELNLILNTNCVACAVVPEEVSVAAYHPCTCVEIIHSVEGITVHMRIYFPSLEGTAISPVFHGYQFDLNELRLRATISEAAVAEFKLIIISGIMRLIGTSYHPIKFIYTSLLNWVNEEAKNEQD